MNADSKGPPVSSDLHGAKKASKKATSRRATDSDPAARPASVVRDVTPLGAAPSNASVPVQHDVPRINIAEPKMPVRTDDAANAERTAKARPAKKRTPTPPEGITSAAPAVGPSLVTPSAAASPLQRAPSEVTKAAPAAAAATAAPKVDALDAEKEQAKREAKKQRAREQEEKKRRMELEQRAREEAKREEEARQREARRLQEVASLNANAEECQEEDQNDYEDEDFEEFEADDSETPPPAQAKASVVLQPVAKRSVGGASVDAVDASELKRIHQALEAESKGLLNKRPEVAHTSSDRSAPSSPSKAAAAADIRAAMSTSIADLKHSIDPRAKRVREILDTVKMEVEAFSVFQLAPVSEMDMYLSRLRRGAVCQAFVQNHTIAREVQTEPPQLVDNGMSFPGDIRLGGTGSVKHLRASRRKPGATSAGQDEEDDEEDDAASASSSARFFEFLEHAAHVCEVLVEDHVDASAKSSMSESNPTQALDQAKSLSQGQLFPSKQFDQPGLELLVAGRPIVALCFSPIVSNLLMVCFGLPNNNGEADHAPAPRSQESITCIFDVNRPDQALYVLHHDGETTAASFGPYREPFALCGTADGSIHAWDLRNQFGCVGLSSIVVKHHVVQAFSPTYATCAMEETHAAPIVSLDMASVRTHDAVHASAFQFASMDDRGGVLIWSVLDVSAGDEALLTDKCAQLGAHIKLVVNAVIESDRLYPCNSQSLKDASTTRKSSSSNKTVMSEPEPMQSIGPTASVISFFPQDSSQFLVGLETGIVVHGHRMSTASVSVTKYHRDRSGVNRVSPMWRSVAAVTCLDFHPTLPDYFLVGYADGIVCLFRTSVAYCLATWEDDAADCMNRVETVRWLPHRPSVFFASYTNGQLVAWDLAHKTQTPDFSFQMPRNELDPSANGPSFALSSDQVRTSRAAIAYCTSSDDDKAPFAFVVQALAPQFAAAQVSDSPEAIQRMFALLG